MVSPFASVAPAPAGLAACANWIAAWVALSARAAVSGPASTVAPSSAAIATERATGADMAIGRAKDDMAVSFLDVGSELVVCRSAAYERPNRRYRPTAGVGLIQINLRSKYL